MKKTRSVAKRIAAVLLAGALMVGTVMVPVSAAEDKGNTPEVFIEKIEEKTLAAEAGATKGSTEEASSQTEMEGSSEAGTLNEAVAEKVSETAAVENAEEPGETAADENADRVEETAAVENVEEATESITGEDLKSDASDADRSGEESDKGEDGEAAAVRTAGDAGNVEAAEDAASEKTVQKEDTAEEMKADDVAGVGEDQRNNPGAVVPGEAADGNGSIQEDLITVPEDLETVSSEAMMSTVASGKCGTNLTWTLDSQGTLTISGTGKMNDFNINHSPWYSNRNSIKNAIVKDGVTSIGTWAFNECENMTTVKLGNSLKSIGWSAFHYCEKLRNITIPDSVTSISESAFVNCKSLKNITIPKGVKSIEDDTFRLCRSLEGITIPDGLTSLGARAFAQCTSLKSIKLPESLKRIGDGAFAICSSLTSITIPDSVTIIEGFAFSECSSLTSIRIPKNIKTIQEYAFNECGGLKKIEIPKTVTSIEEFAFYNCKNLTDVYYTGSKTQWNQIKIENDNDPLLNAAIHYNWNVTQHFSEAVISGLSAKTYTGKALTPAPVVTIGVTRLTPGTDYTVSYANNINAGTATVTIKGKGRFTGTRTASFKINKASQPITVKTTASTITVGKTATVSITGAKGAKSYKSSDSSVATVNSATGLVTGKKLGTVTITAASAATSNYYGASKTIKITVGLHKPGNCRFTRWNNAKYSSCQVAWNKVEGADGYQSLLSWTDGSHAVTTDLKVNVLSQKCSVAVNHVSQFKVRSYKNVSGNRVYGVWSNVVYITPSPTKLTTKNVSSGSDLKMNVSWNIIYGCNGYNVFITTNPNGKWYWNQSTSEKASATSAAITKCGGSKLKKNTKYYVRIVTRRKRNGVFCTVPMPAANTYIGTFIIK